MAVIWRIKYRIGQFWRSIHPTPLSKDDEEEISTVLSDLEMKLFLRQAVPDKRHCMEVLHTLKDSGETNEDILAAALLHDVGKTRSRITRWDRTLVVLTEAIAPALAGKWARGDGSGWRRPFVVKAKHAEWGAEDAAAAGSSGLTVELIRRHHEALNPDALPDSDTGSDQTESDPERLLALLQWADGIN